MTTFTIHENAGATSKIDLEIKNGEHTGYSQENYVYLVYSFGGGTDGYGSSTLSFTDSLWKMGIYR